MAHGLKRLALDQKVETRYCISNDIREDQMRIAISKVSGRFIPTDTLTSEPIALVCYGPSLKKNWEEVRKFKKIMTCSGAHRFLLERGIVPTYHIDLDPREHKVKMLGQPHPEVEYLMASCCHPSMWDVLEGHKVKLWHIFNNEDEKDIPLTYPPGEWILTGGNNVGLRLMVVARSLGYTNQHIFGMDCSFPQGEEHHAGSHLNTHKKIYEVPYAGRTFYVEPVMLTYARQFFHELKQLPDVSINLYGDGLLQHMAHDRKNEKLRTKKSAAIAFKTPVTFTEGHINEMKRLHLNPTYGVSGRKHKDVVIKLTEALKTKNVMDYGCGKGTLASKLPFPIWEYDPAIPGKDSVPRPADLVVCLNVLECVEMDMLDNVLGDLVRCSRKCVFAVIESIDKDFWEKKLNPFFKIGTILQAGPDLHCVLEPREKGPLA